MMVLDSDHSMPAHAMAEGGTFSELLVPTKFGLGSSIPTWEADIFAFGLVVLQVSRPDHRRYSHERVHVCRFSQGNRRSIMPQFTNARRQSSGVYDQENLRTLRVSDSRLLCGNSGRHVGVKTGHCDRGSTRLWILCSRHGEAPGETSERLSHWVFRLTVGFRPTLLGRKHAVATKGYGSRGALRRSGGELVWGHGTLRPGRECRFRL